MKINSVKTKYGIKKDFASFTYDEEQELAASVMETLSKPWASKKLRSIASGIYDECSGGFGCEMNVIIGYCDTLGKWINRVRDSNENVDVPYSPNFIFDNDGMKAPTKTLSGETSKEWKTQWYITERRRAWREVWKVYRKVLCDYSDDYRVFPGDSNDGLEQQELAELEVFFGAVKKSRKTYKCSVDQAMREVMDRIPHASLTLEELHDISSEYP